MFRSYTDDKYYRRIMDRWQKPLEKK